MVYLTASIGLNVILLLLLSLFLLLLLLMVLLFLLLLSLLYKHKNLSFCHKQTCIRRLQAASISRVFSRGDD